MTEHDLRSHLFNIPNRLKHSALAFAISYVWLLLPDIDKDFGYAWYSYPSLMFGLLMGSIMFFAPFHKAFFDRRRSLRQLEESGLLEEALADFSAADDFGKYGRIGQRFFFGFDTGVVVEIAQISRIYTDHYNVRIVLNTGEERIMCSITGSLAATTLLQERIDALLSRPD